MVATFSIPTTYCAYLDARVLGDRVELLLAQYVLGRLVRVEDAHLGWRRGCSPGWGQGQGQGQGQDQGRDQG
eukprot:scaffold64931_cov37-Phaeocystis_antarctica.AAC.1